MILVDSNVLVAALFDEHPHNPPSVAFINSVSPDRIMVAAHSLSEAYSTLTRPNRPYRLTGPEAAEAIAAFVNDTRVVALSPSQTLEAIRRFAGIGTGPRLYDYLIGTTGALFGADTIVTWNIRDFDGLFPALRIVTPADVLPTLP